jgi:hypothetical protein
MDFRQIKAIENANKGRILKVCPDCSEESGIYFLLREENGFKFAYIGKAKHLLSRLAQHLQGYKQHIDRSLKKHGLWSEDNPTGWKVHFLRFPENELNEKEQYFIRKYATAGYQLRNVESGGNLGKTDIGDRKQSRGYYDGLDAGYNRARKEIAHLFELHLECSTKRNPPTKLQEKAMEKFTKFIEVESDD